MPQMNGIEFLAEAMKIYPNACRVLLTAYADTGAAIQAINEIKLDHYLLKPWDPPEDNLYPIINDLLDDWLAEYTPRFEGLRVLGSRWSPKSYDLREFLARNRIPYQWLDVEAADTDNEVKRLVSKLEPEALNHLPLVLFPDGGRLAEPPHSEVAERIGLKTRAETEFYDLVITGAGPAGLAAAVYGASEGLKTLMIEREAPGGQAGLSSRIENYLGFHQGISGSELTRRAVLQAQRFQVEILAPQEVEALRVDGPYRYLKLSNGTEVWCHALVIATGLQWRKLDIPGMDRLQGAGVYYGAGIVEARSCKDEDVYVVGGANSAGQAAVHFSGYARRVVMLVRGESLAATMSQYLIDEIGRTANIHVEFQTQVTEVHGAERLEAITIECGRTNTSQRVDACAMFIFIGAQPGTDWLDGIVARDKNGFILTGSSLMEDGKPPRTWTLRRPPTLLETSVPGIFAVGDVRHGSVKRVASGVGEGSIAIQFVHQYLSKA
jgi:thioredoxin reductase (NADPH)